MPLLLASWGRSHRPRRRVTCCTFLGRETIHLIRLTAVEGIRACARVRTLT